MLHVASVCTPCCMLLDVVGSCCAKLETGQTFQPTTPNISFVPWSLKRSATMLDPFGQLFQHCWGHARPLRMDYKDLWVVFFPRCIVGPNIVGSCCIRLHTTANTHATTPNISFVPWSPKHSATMLDPFGQLFQHCWGHVRSLRMDYKDLWVVFFPRCIAGPNIVGSCCIRLHTTANTHATTTNIVGATMLGVVAPVCTQPKIRVYAKRQLWICTTWPLNSVSPLFIASTQK